MNIPKAFEQALAAVIRLHSQPGHNVVIRAWQSLACDGTWDAQTDRAFPMIDLRCAPPVIDDSQATLSAECSILCGTKTDDDKDHSVISAMYQEVQEVIDRLYSQFRTQTITGVEYITFTNSMADSIHDSNYIFGGLSFGTSLAPYNDNGINMIGFSLKLHYSRKEF